MGIPNCHIKVGGLRVTQTHMALGVGQRIEITSIALMIGMLALEALTTIIRPDSENESGARRTCEGGTGVCSACVVADPQIPISNVVQRPDPSGELLFRSHDR